MDTQGNPRTVRLATFVSSSTVKSTNNILHISAFLLQVQSQAQLVSVKHIDFFFSLWGLCYYLNKTNCAASRHWELLASPMYFVRTHYCSPVAPEN